MSGWGLNYSDCGSAVIRMTLQWLGYSILNTIPDLKLINFAMCNVVVIVVAIVVVIIVVVVVVVLHVVIAYISFFHLFLDFCYFLMEVANGVIRLVCDHMHQ